MLKTGLTGNIGSGKSVVASVFENLGIPVYHSDEKAKLFLDDPEIIIELKKTFGSAIINEAGKVDRKNLASAVFSDSSNLELLNRIIHPCVISDFGFWLNSHSSFPYVVMESAILFETGFSDIFDKIIIVSAPESLRIERVMKRDCCTEDDVKTRAKKQMPEAENVRKADFVIYNDGTELLIPQVLKIHESLCRNISDCFIQ